MNAFRFFSPVATIATRTFRFGAGRAAAQQPFRPPVNRPVHTLFTVNGSKRAGSSWQTRFQRARAQAQSQQQRGYRQQLFNRNNVLATGMLFRRWSQRPTFYYEVAGLAGVCGIYYVYNLETVPVSGRVRFNCLSEDTEKWMGQQSFKELLSEYNGRILPESSKEHRMALRVMERLVPHCGLEGQDWEVRVIKDDEQKNAFVLPGGKVFVFSGILSVCQNDDGLAAVLGHEIAHNVAHHAVEQASRSLILLPIGVLAYLASGVDPQLLRMFTSLAFTLPGSRKQEEEADYIGLLMMSESCYDPQAALRLWTAMEQEENGRGAPPQYLSTHPSSHNRVEKIQGWLGEANEKRQMSDCAATTWHAEKFREVAGFPRW